MNEMGNFSPVGAQSNFRFGDNGAYEYCFLRSDANRFERDFSIEHCNSAFVISSARAASNQAVDILATIWTQIIWIIGATDLASDPMFAFSVMSVFRSNENFEWYFSDQVSQMRQRGLKTQAFSLKNWRDHDYLLGCSFAVRAWRLHLEIEDEIVHNNSVPIIEGVRLNRATPSIITKVLEALCE